jgi:hypothetical protein
VRIPSLLALAACAACVQPLDPDEVDLSGFADAGPDAGADDVDAGSDEVDAGAVFDAGSEPVVDGGTAFDAPLRVVVLSDLNGSYGSTSYGGAVHDAVDDVIALAPDLVLSTGDMVAGQQGGIDHRAMWQGFHAAVSEPLAQAGIPFAPTPGNHDASGYAGFGGERAIFVDEWQSRRPDVEYIDDADFPLRYAFSQGPVLFISLDATLVSPFDDETRAWVQAQLVAGAALPVKIVYGHVPLHPFTQGRETEVSGDTQMEALLVEHDVTLFISGHHHAYYPGRHDDLRVVSTACLGDGPRRLVGDSATSQRSYLVLDIDGGALTAVEAYAPRSTSPIARSSLPASLSHGGVTIVRDDL